MTNVHLDRMAEYMLLPAARAWVRFTVRRHAAVARPLSFAIRDDLAGFFSNEILDRARLAAVKQVPMPPCFRAFAPKMPAGMAAEPPAMTLLHTIFMQEAVAGRMDVVFHELIHVLQWHLLGAKGFLKAYVTAFVRDGYASVSLERTAYTLQDRFFRSRGRPFDAEAEVRAELRRQGLLREV